MRFYTSSVRHIHLEPTTDCNARCPQCARTDGCTLSVKPDLVIDEVSADELRNLLATPEFSNIEYVLISGNYGDIVMHTHPRKLLEVLLEKNIQVRMNTNGGAQSSAFWSWLGSTNVEVEFAIDGLEDTHDLYRRNTRYDVVINNAKRFIDAGGHAVCAMNVFLHNEHQKKDLAKVCKDLGFKDITYRADERFYSPEGVACYDNDGNITHYLEPTTEYTNRFHKKELLPYQTARTKELDKTVKCRVLNKDGFINKHDMHSIYISGSMKTWPCCWMEFDSILETNDLRNNSFEIINKEFYQKISSKWGKPQCLDVCVRKCSIETIADRLQPYESGMTA